MNVLQINRNYSNGGAAVVAKRLHDAINSCSENSSTLLCRNAGGEPNKSVVELYPKLTGRIKSALIDRFEQLTGFQYFFQKNIRSICDLDVFKNADVVHFHITHGGYINQKFIAEVARLKPVVWSFHDMWALTGRCAHSYECDKWITGCGRCPNLRTYPAQYIDRSGYLWNLKKNLYLDIKVDIVSPSKWLQEKITKSIVNHWPCTVIPNPIDLSVFKYNKKQSKNIRSKLGLPRNKKIFLFVAHGGVENEYKGFNILKDVFSKMKGTENTPYLLVIGGREKHDLDSIGLSGESLGVVVDEALLAEYYAASDFYIIPSVQENLPLTIIESLGCGTPVIAFNVGGIPEMLEHKITGYLAENTTNESLLEGINWACSLSYEEYSKASMACRDFSENHYSIDEFVSKHMCIYKSSIDNFIV